VVGTAVKSTAEKAATQPKYDQQKFDRVIKYTPILPRLTG